MTANTPKPRRTWRCPRCRMRVVNNMPAWRAHQRTKRHRAAMEGR